MEENNSEQPQNYHLKNAKIQMEKAEIAATKADEYAHDLQTNIRYKDFFAKYNPQSVEEFIKNYSQNKVFWLEYGSKFWDEKKEHQLLYFNKAEECLWEIQQKKLFNTQCQWRAEQVNIPEIKLCADFDYWERHISECLFIPQITPDDVELYIQYLHNDKDKYKDRWCYDEWQNYDEFKEVYETDNDDAIPQWYQFYDNRRGTGRLFSLPDIRGNKEEFYMDIWRKSLPHIPKSEVSKPYLSSYGDDIEEFIRTFEEKKMLRFYYAYRNKEDFSVRSIYDDEDLADILETLMNADEIVPMQANINWRDAIFEAAAGYITNQVIECLPQAYDEYLMKIENGFKLGKENRTKDWTFEHSSFVRECIIKARIINGEPPNLEF